MYVLVKYEDNYDGFYLSGYQLLTEDYWNECLDQMDIYFAKEGVFYHQFCSDHRFIYRSKEAVMDYLTIEYLREDELEDTFRYLPREFGQYFPFDLFWEC